MALPTFNTNMLNFTNIAEDYPQDNGANPITPDGMRALLDKAGVDVKSFLNDIFIPALIAANIPFAPGGGISSTNIEAAVKETYAAIAEAVTGGIVDGSVTFAKLADTVFASQADAQTATATNKLVTPLRVKEYVTYILATLAEAQAGTSEVKLSTPKRVADYVTAIKATQAEAEAGVNTTHWTTPERVKQAITALGVKCAVGSYTGTTAATAYGTQSITTGFQPDMVVVVQSSVALNGALDLTPTNIGYRWPVAIIGGSTITSAYNSITVLGRTSTGFTVGSDYDSSSPKDYYPKCNLLGTTYYYFAIKKAA